MKPDTEANINKALEWLQQTGGAIQDFASEQAPLYCQEVVAWELWSGFFFGGMGLAFMVIAIIAAHKFVTLVDKGEESKACLAIAVAVASLVLGPVMFSLNAPRAIKAAVSPRLVIIEHLNKLRK